MFPFFVKGKYPAVSTSTLQRLLQLRGRSHYAADIGFHSMFEIFAMSTPPVTALRQHMIEDMELAVWKIAMPLS